MTYELLDIRIKKFKKCQLSCFYCDKLKLLVWNITNTCDDQKYDVADYFVESCLLILPATLFKTPLAEEISGA